MVKDTNDDGFYGFISLPSADVLGQLVVICPIDDFVEIIPENQQEKFRLQSRQCHSSGIATFLKDSFSNYADNVLKYSHVES